MFVSGYEIELLIKDSKLAKKKKDELLDYFDREYDKIWQSYEAATDPAFQKFQKERDVVGFNDAWKAYKDIQKAEEEKANAATAALSEDVRNKLGILNSPKKK